jgi:hypothetical protein
MRFSGFQPITLQALIARPEYASLSSLRSFAVQRTELPVILRTIFSCPLLEHKLKMYVALVCKETLAGGLKICNKHSKLKTSTRRTLTSSTLHGTQEQPRSPGHEHRSLLKY